MVAHRPSEFWNGPQARLPDAFWMSKQKGERTIAAVCEVWTHPSGWELRLIIGAPDADDVRRSVGPGDARDH